MPTRRKFVTTSAGMILVSTAVAQMMEGCSGGGGTDGTPTAPTPTPTPTPIINAGIMTLPVADHPDLAAADGSATFLVPAGPLVIIAHLDNGTGSNAYVCLSAVCTHQGCTVGFTPNSNNFTCPCHGSVYASTGSNISGPAPAPLHAYTTTFDGTTITVDLNS